MSTPDPLMLQRLDVIAASATNLALVVEAQITRLALLEQAETVSRGLPPLAKAFTSLARCVRQTAAFQAKLRADAARAETTVSETEQRRIVTRQTLIRRTENEIARQPKPERENLLRDFYERLDDPDFDATILATVPNRPFTPDQLYTDLTRDLGIADKLIHTPRRTLAELKTLVARAAARPALSPGAPVPLHASG